MNLNEYIGKEVKIGEKYGEITRVLGCFLEVTFYDLNEGRIAVDPKDIEKFVTNDF